MAGRPKGKNDRRAGKSPDKTNKTAKSAAAKTTGHYSCPDTYGFIPTALRLTVADMWPSMLVLAFLVQTTLCNAPCYTKPTTRTQTRNIYKSVMPTSC